MSCRTSKKVCFLLETTSLILLFLSIFVTLNNRNMQYKAGYNEVASSESIRSEGQIFNPSIGDYFTCETNVNESEFFDWWNAAENGNEWAQCRMGDYCFTTGKVVHNHCEALKWWLASAEQGNVVAKYRLIKYYFLTSFEEWCRPHPFLHGLFF